MLTRKDWIWLGTLALFGVVIVVELFFVGCGDDEAAECPDSLASNSAEWSSPAAGQCAELADALNASGVDVTGGDDSGTGECTGRMSEARSGGMCHATIASQCDSGLSFELDCIVKRDRTADCDVTIEAPELERPCRLQVLLR